MNKTQLIGRVTKELELQKTNNGKSYVKFSIAVDREYKDANGNRITDFFNCIAWDKLAETLCQYVTKGNKLYVDGNMVSSKYEKNGSSYINWDLVVKVCEFLESKPNEQKQQEPQVAKHYKPEEMQKVDDEELPF